MNNQHPIPSPPTELVQQWINEGDGIFAEPLAASAARWGYQQATEELETFLRKNNENYWINQ